MSREALAEQWSFGFETPITNFTFVDLKPDTEYEFQVRIKTAAGEGPPALFRVRTGPTGNSGSYSRILVTVWVRRRLEVVA